MIKLALFDIDGTLRQVRSPWRHLHQFLGLSEKAKDFFPMFNDGKISYEKWVELDASLWKGISKDKIVKAIEENPIREGAKNLIHWLKSRDVICIGISTGLSVYAEITKQELGLHDIFCNELLFDESSNCLGEVKINVTEFNKGELALQVFSTFSCDSSNVIAFGDGKADIKMFEVCNYKIAILPSDDNLANISDYVVDKEPIDTIIEYLETIFHNDTTRNNN